MKIKHSTNFSQKQQGATLFTALVFLTLMTIVSVTAAKIASVDSRISGNNQLQMQAYQQTDQTLTGFTNPVVVIKSIILNGGVREAAWVQTLGTNTSQPRTVNATREVINRQVSYPCKSNGLATSVGNDSSPNCHVFDLNANDRLINTNITDRHVRGVGKLLPNTSNYED